MMSDLRGEKRAVLERVREHLRENRAGYIRVPTGWGKTFLAKHLMTQYLKEGRNVVYIVRGNNALLFQTFEDKTSELGKAVTFLCGEREKPSSEELKSMLTNGRGSVVAATVETLVEESNSPLHDELLSRCNLMVVDEIHNFIANKGNEVIEQAFDSGAHIFGMTATPMQGVVDRLKFVREILPGMDEVWSKSMAQCIIDGDLSGGDYYVLQSRLCVSGVFGEPSLESLERMDETVIDIGSGDEEQQIELLVRRSQLAHDAYTRYMNGEKVLVFCAPTRTGVQNDETERVKSFHSKMTAAVFNEEVRGRIQPDFGFENYRDGSPKMACYLSSDLPYQEQQKLIESFRSASSDPQVLCTIGMLVEGFDFPDLKNMILLRPTRSQRLFTQQLGRVLRRSDHGERARVVEIVDDTSPMYDLLETSIVQGRTGADGASALLSLNPAERVANVIAEGGDFSAFRKGCVSLHDIIIRDSDGNWSVEARQLLPVQARAELVSSLLSRIREVSEGKLAKQRLGLFQILSGVSLLSTNDTERVRGIVSMLEDETRIIESRAEQHPMSTNARNAKLKMFQALKWYLICRALSSIESERSVLSHEEKVRCISTLGLPETVSSPKEGMLFCLEKGRHIVSIVSLRKRIEGDLRTAKVVGKLLKGGWLTRQAFEKAYFEELLWIDCFRDDSEVAHLIEALKRSLRTTGFKKLG